jgi:hypothetical protein
MAALPGETAKALYGTYRFARFDPDAMDYFRNTNGAFWRSFKAALYIAPFYAALLLMRYSMGEVSSPMGRFIVVEALAYIIAWLAFPVIVEPLTKSMGRGDRFVRYIIAYNWAAVLQNLLYMPLAMLSVSGALPPGGAGLMGFVVLLMIMTYTWFITRTALQISGSRALGLVALDFALSFLINGYAEKML